MIGCVAGGYDESGNVLEQSKKEKEWRKCRVSERRRMV